MYKIIETSEGRLTEKEVRTKAEAMQTMRRAARAARAFGIRSRIEIEKDGKVIDSRTTSGTKYAR